MKKCMCGIVGYIGKNRALPILLDGLRRLEYRGYDSSGIVICDDIFHDFRVVGKIKELDKKIANMSLGGNIGIAHTRWATHGAPTENNAHPHCEYYPYNRNVGEHYFFWARHASPSEYVQCQYFRQGSYWQFFYPTLLFYPQL